MCSAQDNSHIVGHNNFVLKVGCFIEEHQLFDRSDHLLVGVSGGSDSVGLLLVLMELGYEVTAAHCNFGLRGEESDRDEQFVRDLCQRLGVRCFVTRFDTEAYARKHHTSIEMAARELRYGYFDQLAKDHGFDKICVAHHSDDNIETFFINLLRGSGLRGLCGMPVKNGMVTRPLLGCSREDILAYLASKDETYITDGTNLESIYLRNRIRLELLPLLENMKGSARGSILTTLSNLSEANKLYTWCIGRMEEECCFVRDGLLYVSKEALQRSPSPLCLLHETIRECGFNRSQEQQMLVSLDETGKQFFSDQYVLTIDRDYLVVDERREDGFLPEMHVLEGSSGTIHLANGQEIGYRIVDAAKLVIDKSSRFGFFDLSKLGRSVVFRPWQEGDIFRPFGMKGRKLVSDLLTDLKLNRMEKERQWVMLTSAEIAWVLNVRSSEDFRVDAGTQDVVVFELLSNKGHN